MVQFDKPGPRHGHAHQEDLRMAQNAPAPELVAEACVDALGGVYLLLQAGKNHAGLGTAIMAKAECLAA